MKRYEYPGMTLDIEDDWTDPTSTARLLEDQARFESRSSRQAMIWGVLSLAVVAGMLSNPAREWFAQAPMLVQVIMLGIGMLLGLIGVSMLFCSIIDNNHAYMIRSDARDERKGMPRDVREPSHPGF